MLYKCIHVIHVELWIHMKCGVRYAPNNIGMIDGIYIWLCHTTVCEPLCATYAITYME